MSLNSTIFLLQLSLTFYCLEAANVDTKAAQMYSIKIMQGCADWSQISELSQRCHEDSFPHSEKQQGRTGKKKKKI